MIKSMRVGNTIICVINTKMYQKNCSSTEEILNVYETALNTDENNPVEVASLIELLVVKSSEELKVEQKIKELENEAEEQRTLLEWLDDIRNLGDEHFEVVDARLYLKGINITIPEFLAMEFAKRKHQEEDIQSLINFWKLLALNPDPRCREDLYKFLKNHDMSVTPSGYLVCYRNVNIKQEGGIDIEMQRVISESWVKTKKWRTKGPSHYSLILNLETKEYITILTEKLDYVDYEWELVGNVKELYKSLTVDEEKQTIYTDAYTGTFNIKLGELVSVDRSECDASPDVTCSRGLHLASSSWLTNNYFGQQGIVALVDPRNVISVPYSDGGKMRCCEYLPIALAEYDDTGSIIPVDTATFEYDYAVHTKEQIEEMLSVARFESLKDHNIIPKEIDVATLRNSLYNVKQSIESINLAIRDRVTNI
jgi:hypothetical protein